MHRNTARTLFYWTASAILLVFALLQWNDPDPWLWVPLYGAAAGLFLVATFGVYHRSALLVVLAAYAAISVVLLPGFVEWLLHHPWSDLTGTMSTERQYIEDSRELLGLVIAAALLGMLWRWPPGRPRAEHS